MPLLLGTTGHIRRRVRRVAAVHFRDTPRLVRTQANNLSVAFLHESLSRHEGEHHKHLQIRGAPARLPIRQRGLLRNQQIERLAPAGSAIVVNLGEVYRRGLALAATIFEPVHADAPASLALMDEPKRLLAFLAGVGEADMDVVRKLAVIGFEDVPEHVARRASTAEADERWTFDPVRVATHASSQTIFSVGNSSTKPTRSRRRK
jgi:hypothetical protein